MPVKTTTNIQIRITSILLVFSILFSFSACNTKNIESFESKTIIDCMGREVEIPKDPQRVACLYASIAHMMALLDQADKIVGTSNGIKRDVIMRTIRPDIVDVAEPYQSGSINIEEIIKIDTDLVLLQKGLAITDNEVAKLDKLGIPYAVVDYTNIEELQTAIKTVGEIFNEQEKAEAYLKFFDETISMVQTRLADIDDEDRTVVYHALNEAVKTDIKGGLCGEIFELAKLNDISTTLEHAKETDKATNVTLEEIYKWNPDAIVCNEYTVTDYILTDNKWAGLKAVEDKQVFTLPIGATRWAHQGSIEAHMAVLSLGYIFYPDRFEDIDYKAYIHDYYRDFWGIDLPDDDIEKVISGNGMRDPKG